MLKYLLKISSIKVHENPFRGSRVFLCGETDGYGDASTCYSLFRNTLNRYLKLGHFVDFVKHVVFSTERTT